MEDQTIIILTALILLAVIEILAMMIGIDGAALATVLAIFGGVVGYSAKAKRG